VEFSCARIGVYSGACATAFRMKAGDYSASRPIKKARQERQHKCTGNRAPFAIFLCTKIGNLYQNQKFDLLRTGLRALPVAASGFYAAAHPHLEENLHIHE
jgi:hypothetical protein